MSEYLKRLVYLATGNRTYRHYDDLRRQERLSLEVNRKRQQERLKAVLAHAAEKVPYYSKVLRAAGAVVSGAVRLENFSAIPVLTKDIIRREGMELYDRDYGRRRPYLVATGGSTGDPAEFMRDQDQKEEDMAMIAVQNSYAAGGQTRRLKLWGSVRDILKEKESLKSRLSHWLDGDRTLNAFLMSDERMGEYVQAIKDFRPDVIEAYVHSLYELASFVKKKNLVVHSPKAVMTSAGTLYPHMKALFEEVFRCPVYNRYGSRELPALACSCRHGQGLHLNILTNFFEILDEGMNPCRPSQFGKIYVTSLNAFTMPLIRYDIGDVAVPDAEERCACGRGLPLVESIRGRDLNIFRTKTGQLADGGYLTVLFFGRKWVRRFQIIQKALDVLHIRVVLDGERQTGEMVEIERGVRLMMGEDTRIDWFFVGEIAPSKSGKFMYVVSEAQ